MEPLNYCVVDLEMTGLSAANDRVIEVGAVRVRDGKPEAFFQELCNPGCAIPQKVVELTGITNEAVENCQTSDEVLQRLVEFIGQDLTVGHNFSFDYRFLKQWAVNHKVKLELNTCDTLKIARKLLPQEQSKKLVDLCSYFGINQENAHRALDDAVATARLFEGLKELAGDGQQELFVPQTLQIKVKKQTPATSHQVERLRTYRELHQIQDEIPWDTLTRSQASRIMDKYYATYGR